jgi:amino acid transporter
VHATLAEAEQMLHRSSTDGTLPAGLASLHTRFGTPARSVDIAVIAISVVVFASGGRVAWLSRAYTIAIAAMLVLTIAALIRVRRSRQGPMPFKVRGNLRLGRVERPVGLLLSAAVVATTAAAMVLTGDVPSIATGIAIAVLSLWFVRATPTAAPLDTSADESTFDLLLAAELSPDQIAARRSWCRFATHMHSGTCSPHCRHPATAMSS